MFFDRSPLPALWACASLVSFEECPYIPTAKAPVGRGTYIPQCQIFDFTHYRMYGGIASTMLQFAYYKSRVFVHCQDRLSTFLLIL